MIQIYNIDDVMAIYYLDFFAIGIIQPGINIWSDVFLATDQLITFSPNVLLAELLLYVFSLPACLPVFKNSLIVKAEPQKLARVTIPSSTHHNA